jgi:hypothetical protein
MQLLVGFILFLSLSGAAGQKLCLTCSRVVINVAARPAQFMANHQDVEMQPQLQIYGLLLRREWKYANAWRASLSLCFGNYVGHCNQTLDRAERERERDGSAVGRNGFIFQITERTKVSLAAFYGCATRPVCLSRIETKYKVSGAKCGGAADYLLSRRSD